MIKTYAVRKTNVRVRGNSSCDDFFDLYFAPHDYNHGTPDDVADSLEKTFAPYPIPKQLLNFAEVTGIEYMVFSVDIDNTDRPLLKFHRQFESKVRDYLQRVNGYNLFNNKHTTTVIDHMAKTVWEFDGRVVTSCKVVPKTEDDVFEEDVIQFSDVAIGQTFEFVEFNPDDVFVKIADGRAMNITPGAQRGWIVEPSIDGPVKNREIIQEIY